MTDETITAIVDSYSRIFDLKDEQEPGSDVFLAAYNALAAIEQLGYLLGIEVPERYDRKRT